MSGASWRRAAEAAAALVRARTGLALSGGGPDVEPALRRVAAAAEQRDPARCLRRLAREESAFDALVAELTVGESYFFREPEQLGFLRRTVLPDLAARRPSGVVRAWSAGCATGEEAYTLAILLREAGLGERMRVLGTDIARARLERARRGLYRRWSLRGVPAAAVAAYFTPADGAFLLNEPIRAAVEFRHLNLAGDAAPSDPCGLDLILCRNVMIYLDRDAVARVARRLLEALSPDGWLFLGASDPPLSGLVPCEVVVTGAGVAYRRAAGGGRARRPAPASAAAAAPASAALAMVSAAPVPASAPAIEPPAPAAVGAAAFADGLPDAGVSASAPRPGAGDEAAAVARVRALADGGRLEEAARACAEALGRFGACAELLYLHAALLAEAGRHAESAAAARRALYLDRGLVVAQLALGAALARLGDVEGARRALGGARRLLAGLPPGDVVPASGGETAGALAGLARVQLELIGGVAA